MLDPRLLRNDLDNVARNLARRGVVLDRNQYLELESSRKTLQVEVEAFRKERNERSKAIGQAKAAGEDIEPLRLKVGELATKLAESEARLQDVQTELVLLRRAYSRTSGSSLWTSPGPTRLRTQSAMVY